MANSVTSGHIVSSFYSWKIGVSVHHKPLHSEVAAKVRHYADLHYQTTGDYRLSVAHNKDIRNESYRRLSILK